MKKRKNSPPQLKGLVTLIVRRAPGKKHQGLITIEGKVFRCALGRNGITTQKREGDGATPRSKMRMLGGFCKPSLKPVPHTVFSMRRVRKTDGWCDSVGNANYNRAVHLPFKDSHEDMLRQDALYDIGFILDWNFSCRKQGCGSAIFLHLAKPGYQPTQGCIALLRRDMERLTPHFSRSTRWVVL